jgi:glycosyltransferase involved in cell wall biosynthesis
VSNKKPLTLSIVIPVYNEEDHLKRCLDAIALQSEKPDEIIVVDNNSRDKSLEIAKSFPGVKILKEKQQGVVFARNSGFDAAQSDIIGRIDADTVLPKDWVARVKDFYAQAPNKNIALTGGGDPTNLRLPRLWGWLQGQIAFRINRLLLGHYILFGSNMALPRSLWQTVRKDVCLTTTVHEDLDLAIHVHRRGFPIVYRESLRVRGTAKRILSNHDQLLANLMLWPQTLRHHHIWTWVFGWLGAVLLYLLSPILIGVDFIARTMGRHSK